MRGTRYTKYWLSLSLIAFCLLCGWLVVESGVFNCSSPDGRRCILLQQTAEDQDDGKNDPNNAAAVAEAPKLEPNKSISFGADDAPPVKVILGAEYPNTEDPDEGYKIQWELSSKGAAISRAIFSNGNNNGFDDRDPENPRPLVVFSPVKKWDGTEVLSMANTAFVLADYGLQLPLDRLHWKSFGVEKTGDGSQIAKFQTVIRIEDTNEPVIKLTKTYTVKPGTYTLDFDIVVENLSNKAEKIKFNLSGPGGLGREGLRSDMRKVVAGFMEGQGEDKEVVSERLVAKDLRNADGIKDRRLTVPGANFLWTAAVNKYFAAILVPQPDPNEDYCNWIADNLGRIDDPDGQPKSGDEAIGVDLNIASTILAAAGEERDSKTYAFRLYIGPKDKSLFDKNEEYRKLGFLHTIDFMGCCCPASIIKPLAFGIIAIMKWMYGFIGNYGIVIIILVFCVRIVMHPVTKKSQISMSKMQKLAPKAEEIKKKYANNKAEMNKQMMTLYRTQGASPIMGFLPMMVQMPIWIALWSAVYASIDLRGASFLPFWITDLSMPDAAFVFPKAIVVPLVNWKIASLNLLPLMMGVAFYLQQKLMPKQGAAATNPQVAQQQKMMMIMMPLLFPLMLYNAPSGVNLYIMSSTFAGVIEQYVIRKHIREKEEVESLGLVAATSKTGGKAKKKKPKPFYKS